MHSERLARHERIGLSFSGGKDSLACVYLLRDHLDRITIYHNDTGDLLPEVRAVVDHVKGFAPHFVHIHTDVAAWIADHGLPSDLVPWTAHPVAAMAGQQPERIVQRYECCFANLMMPTWARMKADGVTLVIRGTRRTDMPRLPVADGGTMDGVEFFYPVQEWTAAQVFDYLRSVGAPIARVYEAGSQAPECATCSAWLGERRAAYLRTYHPDLFDRYRERVARVTAAIDPPLRELLAEMKELSR